MVDLIDCSKANQEFRGNPGEFAYPRELLLRLILMSVSMEDSLQEKLKENTYRHCIYVYCSNGKTIIHDNSTI